MSPISLPRIAVPGLHGRRRLPRRVHVPPREGQAATRRGLDGPRYAPRRDDDDDPRSVTTSEGGARARRRGAHTQRRGSKNVDRVRDRATTSPPRARRSSRRPCGTRAHSCAATKTAAWSTPANGTWCVYFNSRTRNWTDVVFCVQPLLELIRGGFLRFILTPGSAAAGVGRDEGERGDRDDRAPARHRLPQGRDIPTRLRPGCSRRYHVHRRRPIPVRRHPTSQQTPRMTLGDVTSQVPARHRPGR